MAIPIEMMLFTTFFVTSLPGLPNVYPNCRCARGQKHGPHYYLSTRRGGKTKMDYTPRILMNQVKKELGNYRKFKQLLRELLELNYQTFLKERSELKERKKDDR